MGTVTSASPLRMLPLGTLGGVEFVPGVPCSTFHSQVSTSVGLLPATSRL